MKIVADENITQVKEQFSSFAEVITLPGREMTRQQLRDADALLVRSVTRVDQALLEGTRVKFVGTATIGTDHIDKDYLTRQGIVWASAPGSNAEGVVQYVLSALSATLNDWQQKTVAIVGCGNVGGRLYRKLKGLGVSCKCYDPFLTKQQIPDLVGFEEILSCEIICLHTPLTETGRYPTHHLFSEAVLRKLQPGCLLINAGRGAVLDNSALLTVLNEMPLKVVLDVWEGEPSIQLQLLEKVLLATPHIAGYSYDGKLRGTQLIRDALLNWSGIEQALEPALEVATSSLALGEDPQLVCASSVTGAILASYDIRHDDARMRQRLLSGVDNIAAAFDDMRKHYPQRLEFSHFRVTGRNADDKSSEMLNEQLSLLGFSV